MKFSIIVPSYNQELFIKDTLNNLASLKRSATENGHVIEILVFDSESQPGVQNTINSFKEVIDYAEIKKDLGQFDAINKGIEKSTGDYWTWLNTDDLIDIEGFLKLAAILGENKGIDYIYGAVNYINEKGEVIRRYRSYQLSLKKLYSHTPAIFQPGSFFRKSFTNKVGKLKPYLCCFDYEYVLRCFSNQPVVYCCDFAVADFRFYRTSKTGSMTPVFIMEQLQISKLYGRKWYHFLTYFSYLRLIKHFLFPRK